MLLYSHLHNPHRNQCLNLEVQCKRQHKEGLHHRTLRSMINHFRDWKKEDIPTGLRTQQPWPPKQRPKFLRGQQTPSILFGWFSDDEVLDFNIQYRPKSLHVTKRDKGSHAFQRDVGEIATLIA